jgi:putative transposase
MKQHSKQCFVFSEKRAEFSLFWDALINKVFNADLNAGANHIKVEVDKSFEWLKDKLFKLCNSIKIKSDYEFCRLLRGRQNSGSGKSVTGVTTI